ncbi:aminotransferase class III-fold pyridoxal phosphate-dependent enzyme [Candidatus Protochlamydia sp. W-9]|uniref:aminotransferase class III-fold pyridoxal phosphate-dependent enzyme n=1 Tax=Candidatus Protochlamydia sp. W-9 TaxID=1785087 RepID=UPI00096A523B|nr:aminotransferase class III-fold pyridoxal phosphate-dependent enzyme [Candidatus Protochlamydia sp. W-9]
MTIVLDDYNRIFNKVPSEIIENIQDNFNNYRTFDLKEYQELQNFFKKQLSALGTYEIVIYTTGSEAIQYACIWSLKSGKHHKIAKFKDVYHGNFLLHHEKDLLPLSQPIQLLDFSEDEASMLEQLSTLSSTVVLIEPTFSDYFTIFNQNFYQKLQDKFNNQGNLFILDEIRSGLFRLGTFSFAEQLGLSPDVICFGKGLALGIPISVTCFKKEKFPHIDWRELESFRTSQSLNSFSLNLALRILGYLKSPIFSKVYHKSQELILEYFLKLENLKAVKSITVQGSCVSINFSQYEMSLSKLIRLFRDLYKNKIHCRFPDKYRLILIFPFDIEEIDINYVFNVLKKLLGE